MKEEKILRDLSENDTNVIFIEWYKKNRFRGNLNSRPLAIMSNNSTHLLTLYEDDMLTFYQYSLAQKVDILALIGFHN
jgi:hypothetical protein